MTEPETAAPYEAAKPAKPWLDKIAQSAKAFEKWHDQRANLDKLFSRNERADSADREYALFWANIETLRPAVYARPPVPVVAPRFKDSNPLAREGSEVLERALVVQFEQGDVDGLMKEVRDEFLRYSRGTGWVRLAGQDDALAFDYVAAPDFAHELARTWREVTWVARRAWMTRKAGVKRFGPAFEGVELKKQDPNAAIPSPEDKAPVWEVWDKVSGLVCWVAEGVEDTLDCKPAAEVLAPLSGFWPCPKPAFGTLVPGSLVPVPEIRQYKDQIEEINEYTSRIAALSESLRVRGFYLAGAGDVSSAIEAAIKSTDDRAVLVPISSTAALGGGSFKDSIVWLPIGEILTLIQGLVELRRVVIDDVYQITGLSDIVRGQSDAQETLGAQQLKTQWGSLRIRERQNELARFARDLTRIAAEIMAENFAPDVLFEMAQVQLPPGAMKAEAQAALEGGIQLPEEVTKLLKRPAREEVAQFLANDRARGFVIEIETDSTIQPDEDAEKQRRIEFGTAVGGLFQAAAPIVMQAPMLGPFVVEALKFMAGGFRASRPLESAIDELGEVVRGMAEAAAGPQEPQVDPVAMAKLEIEKAKAEKDAEEKDRRFQLDTAKQQAEMVFKDREQSRADMEAMRADRAEETERGFRERDHGLKERAQGHAEHSSEREHGLKERDAGFREHAADRDAGLRERSQGHTEQAHQDGRHDAREARENDFRREQLRAAAKAPSKD